MRVLIFLFLAYQGVLGEDVLHINNTNELVQFSKNVNNGTKLEVLPDTAMLTMGLV